MVDDSEWMGCGDPEALTLWVDTVYTREDIAFPLHLEGFSCGKAVRVEYKTQELRVVNDEIRILVFIPK